MLPACGGAVRSVGAVPRWGAAAAPVRCMSSMEEAARLPLDMLTEEETMMQEAGTIGASCGLNLSTHCIGEHWLTSSQLCLLLGQQCGALLKRRLHLA